MTFKIQSVLFILIFDQFLGSAIRVFKIQLEDVEVGLFCYQSGSAHSGFFVLFGAERAPAASNSKVAV